LYSCLFLLVIGKQSQKYPLSDFKWIERKSPLPKGQAGFYCTFYCIYLAAPLPYPGNPGLKPEALRPNLSEGLPFSE